MKRAVTAIVASVLTAIYWWIVFTIVYADALFAGDRNPAAPPPSDTEVTTRASVAMAIGILVYAALSLAWRRLIAGRSTAD